MPKISALSTLADVTDTSTLIISTSDTTTTITVDVLRTYVFG